MGGKTKIQPASRTGIEALAGMAEQLLATLPDWGDAVRPEAGRRPPNPFFADFQHLSRHDPDGLLTASIADDVVGFAAAYLRSRQLLVPHVWMLPEHEDQPVAHALMRRVLSFAERSGASDAAFLAHGGAVAHDLFLRFGLPHRLQVYRVVIPAAAAGTLGQALASGRPGTEATRDMVARRAWVGDLEHLDRLVRGVVRPLDHEYWLTERGFRVATVREGKRVAGYGYGRAGWCGPAVASTGEAALAALGWGLQLAADGAETVQLLMPASFESGLDALLHGGGAIGSVAGWMARSQPVGLDRAILGGLTVL